MEQKLGKKSLKIKKQTEKVIKEQSLTDIETIFYVCMLALNQDNIHLNMDAIYSQRDEIVEIIDEEAEKTIEQLENQPNIICSSLCRMVATILTELKDDGVLNIKKAIVQRTPSLDYDEDLEHRILVVTLSDGRKVPIDLQKEIINIQSNNKLEYFGTPKCITKNFLEFDGYSTIEPDEYKKVFDLLEYPHNGQYTNDILNDFKNELPVDLTIQQKLEKVFVKVKELNLKSLSNIELAQAYRSMLGIFFEEEIKPPKNAIKLYKIGEKGKTSCDLVISLSLGNNAFAYYKYNAKESGFNIATNVEIKTLINSGKILTTDPNKTNVHGI